MPRGLLLTAGLIFFSGSALASIEVVEIGLTVAQARDNDAVVSGPNVVFVSNRLGDADVLSFNFDDGIVRFLAIGTGSQTAPDLDGDFAVFVSVDATGNADIGLASLSLGATASLTAAAAADFAPAISGNLIVFVSNRFGSEDILIVDLQTGIVQGLSTTSALEGAPDIDGDLVAWQSFSATDFDIVATRIGGTPFLVASGAGNEIEPAVSGNRIAYLVDGDVAVYDVNTGLTTRVTNDAFAQSDVAIDDDFVVWTETRTGNRDIFLHDLLDGQTYQVTTDPSAQLDPHIDGNTVVYTDGRFGNENIFLAIVDVNHAPVANAGADQSVLLGDTVQLKGSATDIDGDAITAWLWSIDSAPRGSMAVLFKPKVPNASIRPDVAGQYVLSLVASDGRDESAPDTATIEVAPNLPDQDADGVPDGEDNCVAVPNPDQRDTNVDGYGNVCDADLNNDGGVDFLDLGILKSHFFSTNADCDLNGDGSVDFLDLGLMKSGFFQPPGPSGLACAGTIPCP